MTRISVIITAGGIGKRMGGELPKQFLTLQGKPILLHTLEKFYRYDPDAELLITLPSEWRNFWQEILEHHQCSIPHKIVEGGQERYHSIKNALNSCSGQIIAVHDGVRPLVSLATIQRCIDAMENVEAVVPVLPLKESIRKITENGSVAAERSAYRLVQTPQCFKADILRNAYEQPYHGAITDDASLVETSGVKIELVEGNEENIKITSPIDLLLAECYLEIENP